MAMCLMSDHLDSGKCASDSTARTDARTDERNCDGDARVRTASADPTRMTRSDDRDARKTASARNEDDDARATRRVSTNANATDAWTALLRGAKNPTFGASSGRLPGHFVVENFVTAAEETALVAFLDDARRSGAWKPSTFNGKHLGKKWGVEVDLKRRTVTSGRRPMPPELLAIAARLRACAARNLASTSDTSDEEKKKNASADGGAVGKDPGVCLPRAASLVVATFAPNEANAIDYRRALGMELEAHCDDRQMSSGVLVNLSLLGDCVMTYAPDARSKRKTPVESRGAVDVFLPRRSLQVQSGSTRYDFSHAIRNDNLLTDRRGSVTFRDSAPPATRIKVRGE